MGETCWLIGWLNWFNADCLRRGKGGDRDPRRWGKEKTVIINESIHKAQNLVRGDFSKRVYLTLHCHHQEDCCIKMGGDESRFNVSLIVRDKVTRQCPQTTTTFEEKREPKRNRTEVPLLTSLKPVLNWANVCSPEHTSDTSTNYDSFLN